MLLEIANRLINKIGGLRFFDGESVMLRTDEICLYQSACGITYFIVFNPFQKDAEKFFIEMGWSNSGVFPDGAKPSPFAIPELIEQGANGGIVRASLAVYGKDQFWSTSYSTDAVVDFVMDSVWPTLLSQTTNCRR